jgi:hypothetical protein
MGGAGLITGNKLKDNRLLSTPYRSQSTGGGRYRTILLSANLVIIIAICKYTGVYEFGILIVKKTANLLLPIIFYN